MNKQNNNIFIKLFMIIILIFGEIVIGFAQVGRTIYFVAKSGSDNNIGSSALPFLTINKAAHLAKPGDSIIVREGVYREWVNPRRGGSSAENGIVYLAAENEDVRILGSEEVKGWTKQCDGMWKIELEDAFFGSFNPFKSSIRHPEYVSADEAGDGWGWLKYGRWTHRGDVILNGEGLNEKQSYDELLSSPLTWFTDSTTENTVVYANFGEANPNELNVELSVRDHAFFPEKAGLSFITVKGFTFMNVATHWAPPTVFQPGAVGTNGGHHWIIEDNIILYSKGVGISVGIPNDSEERSITGHHIIRNNVIMRCGQAGIAGQSWNSDSQLYGNHIEEINYRKEFGGWETAAIKHHNANNLVIRKNFIRGVYTIDAEQGAAHGIWNDYRNSNWNVSQNVILQTDGHCILSEANWEGPNMYANNIMVGATIGIYSTRGDAWIHNLFIDNKVKWDNQPWGNRPQIGNARWMNNLFIDGGLDAHIIEDHTVYASNVYLDSATYHPDDQNLVVLDKPSNIILEDDDNGMYVTFSIDPSIFDYTYPKVTSSILNLPFTFPADISVDFNGLKREGQNIAGPFTNLKQAKNTFTIYEYPMLFIRALEIIQGSEQN